MPKVSGKGKGSSPKMTIKSLSTGKGYAGAKPVKSSSMFTPNGSTKRPSGMRSGKE